MNKEKMLAESLLAMKETLEDMGYSVEEMQRLADLASDMAKFMRMRESDGKIREGAIYLTFMALESMKDIDAAGGEKGVEYIG